MELLTRSPRLPMPLVGHDLTKLFGGIVAARWLATAPVGIVPSIRIEAIGLGPPTCLAVAEARPTVVGSEPFSSAHRAPDTSVGSAV